MHEGMNSASLKISVIQDASPSKISKTIKISVLYIKNPRRFRWTVVESWNTASEIFRIDSSIGCHISDSGFQTSNSLRNIKYIAYSFLIVGIQDPRNMGDSLRLVCHGTIITRVGGHAEF